MNVILGGLPESELVKVMHCTSTKEIWDKLKNVYEGDEKIKEAKLQTYRGQFEQLKMKENEDIASYFLCICNIVNTMRGIGENMKDKKVIQNILRSLPMRFDAKVSTI